MSLFFNGKVESFLIFENGNLSFKGMMKIEVEESNLELKQIIFYDGQCALCNKAVQVLVKYDKKKVLHFAMLQDPLSIHYLAQFNIDATALDTFAYSKKGKVYTKSDAALNSFKDVSVLGKVLYVFIIVPRFIRNGIYDWVSRNRYKWFGKSDVCQMPEKGWANRLIQSES
mgnify:CR=1 FL=1